MTTVEPPQLGERRLVVHKEAELPLLMIGYHVPQTNHPDFYATNILRTILFQGESSRMYQRLVDKDQIALDVSSSVQPAFDPTLAIIVAQPKQGVDPEKCEKAIYEELERAKNYVDHRPGAGEGEKYPLDGILSPDADDQWARQYHRDV